VSYKAIFKPKIVTNTLNHAEKVRWDTLNWIYSEPIDTRHVAVRDDRRGRGQWFLDEPKYQLWKEEMNESKILWCYGIRKPFKCLSNFLNLLRTVKRGREKPIYCKPCSYSYYMFLILCFQLLHGR
jgi:hypothetical protein